MLVSRIISRHAVQFHQELFIFRMPEQDGFSFEAICECFLLAKYGFRIPIEWLVAPGVLLVGSVFICQRSGSVVILYANVSKGQQQSPEISGMAIQHMGCARHCFLSAARRKENFRRIVFERRSGVQPVCLFRLGQRG